MFQDDNPYAQTLNIAYIALAAWFGFVAVLIIGSALAEKRRSRQHMRINELLSAVDLSAVTERYAKDHKLDLETARSHEAEYRRWMALAGAVGPLGMADCPVDDYWHTAMLFSKQYEDLCRSAFGRVIHHDPLGGSGNGYAKTWLAYQAAYGEEPPADIWPHPGADSLEEARKQYRFRIDKAASPTFAMMTVLAATSVTSSSSSYSSGGCASHGCSSCGGGCGGD